jgi:hypothetical protein
MKVIVTGHTSGIGKAIYKHFLSKGCNVIGMSRSNGYHIIDDQEKIILESKGCDIFVNCAYCGSGQLDLLNALYNKVKNIIVMGSAGADYANVWKDYGINKFQLQEKCKELAEQESKTNIFYLKLAFCENTNWPVFVDEKYKASFSEILKIIDMWLEIPKIYSVEFTFKKTESVINYAKKINTHD